ncbi:hypothetical protein CYMTET_53694 [Cymbomonas tetramitiformis]|uniref:Uncharacterized protein n=1 Tax=Cymbomonas tetramitiformis TaxID=36881 RepID=A0AAE0BGI3_9CHLO|nr:hypothetical protein CYMTET_53694 [Cymbomonas tetramitiformis]
MAKQKEQSAAETLVRKREAAEKELQRSVKYAKLAEAAQQKLARAGQDVKQAKLLKEELVGVLRGMGETPASSARKEVLEGALQELLGQPTPAATAEEEAAAATGFLFQALNDFFVFASPPPASRSNISRDKPGVRVQPTTSWSHQYRHYQIRR